MVERTSEYGWHGSADDRRWQGRAVETEKGSLNDLCRKVPKFKKVPYAIEGEGINPYLDMIVRERMSEASDVLLPSTDSVQMPVAIVSKQYKLVQYYEPLNILMDVLSEHGLNPIHLSAELCLTEFGERMWLSITLPAYCFDSPTSTRFHPGDNYDMNLTLNVLNSVDTTRALEVYIYWYRQICSNGMVYGDKIKFKEIHKQKRMNLPHAIEKFLQDQLRQVDQQQAQLLLWYETEIFIQELMEARPGSVQIEQWLEKSVSKTWNVYAAARAYYIAKTGYDGKFINTGQKKRVKFNELTLEERTAKVPGAFSPARNAYDISQVLSWIASRQGTVNSQLKMMADIQDLMRALLRQKTTTLRG